MQLADEFGMSLARCQAEVSSREFLLWREYKKWKLKNEFNKIHHYLAQIAAEMRRANPRVKDARKVKDKQFLLEFVEKKQEDSSNDPPEVRIAKSKGFWFGLAALAKKPDKRKATDNGRDRKTDRKTSPGKRAVRQGAEEDRRNGRKANRKG